MPSSSTLVIYTLELLLSFGLCCFLPTHPSKAPWYHISIRRATISLSLLFTLRHRSTLCESLSSSSTTTPIGTFTLEQWHAHHTRKTPEEGRVLQGKRRLSVCLTLSIDIGTDIGNVLVETDTVVIGIRNDESRSLGDMIVLSDLSTARFIGENDIVVNTGFI